MLPTYCCNLLCQDQPASHILGQHCGALAHRFFIKQVCPSPQRLLCLWPVHSKGQKPLAEELNCRSGREGGQRLNTGQGCLTYPHRSQKCLQSPSFTHCDPPSSLPAIVHYTFRESPSGRYVPVKALQQHPLAVPKSLNRAWATTAVLSAGVEPECLPASERCLARQAAKACTHLIQLTLHRLGHGSEPQPPADL